MPRTRPYYAPAGRHLAGLSPDGKPLAVTGYHEVLLYDADEATGWSAADRHLGARAVAGVLAGRQEARGRRRRAGRFGEVQVWDVGEEKLLISAPVTFDTLYGVSWSPDGKKIAFGCADNTVRAIDAVTGKQIAPDGHALRLGARHGLLAGRQHLVSVSRDMTMKLTEVATQRFIDNVTSITPGALKGGLMAVDRRPMMTVKKRSRGAPADQGRRTPRAKPKVYDEVLGPASDGTAAALQDAPRGRSARDRRRLEPDPRVRGDAGPRLGGRVRPGRRKFAAVSSLDGKGEVRVYDTNSGSKVGARR